MSKQDVGFLLQKKMENCKKENHIMFLLLLKLKKRQKEELKCEENRGKFSCKV